MKRPSDLIFGIGLLLLGGTALAQELTDVTGVRVKLSDRPSRVVALAPSLCELAADLSGDDLGRIVGVTDYTDYPPPLRKVKSVGNYAHFNLEAVIGLKPDLVLATVDGNSKEQIDHLRALGAPVLVVDTQSLSGIEDSIRKVAQAMGSKAEGERMIAQLSKGLAHFRERTAGRTKPKVLLQVGSDPLVVVGKKSFLNEALDAIGAVNAYGDTEARYPRPSLEDALHRNPDILLVLVLGDDPKPFIATAEAWKRFSELKAVKAHQVRTLKADALLRPTLRLLEGLALLERAVHGSK